MKKLITVGIITVLTLGLAGCNWFQPTEPKDEAPAKVTESNETEETVVEEPVETKTPNKVPGLIQPQDQPTNMIYAPGADKL